MRIGITGANGLFGSGLTSVMGATHHAIPLTRAQADLADFEQAERALRDLKLDVLVHAAANPDPDNCELHPEDAVRANVVATENLALLSEQLGFAIALISTDAVFDGTKTSPYLETDRPNPISVYGRTKLAAELAIERLNRFWIFRVAVLFGPGKLNFIDKGLKIIGAGETYVVAADQVGGAVYTIDAAKKILEVIDAQRFGLYHLANAGPCSRLQLAQEAAKMAGADLSKVIGKSLDDMGRPGPRPNFTVMEMRQLTVAGFTLLRPWPAALQEYIHTYLSKARS
jgi:dTDP-4-dehydrorhamnose reductase